MTFFRRLHGWWSGSNKNNNISPVSLIAALVFIAGAVTMSLEFSTSRLLIPVFGSSIYTWGSVIGVILAGLSLGYHVGGRFADKKDSNFEKFCSIIFSAGLFIVFMPYISPIIISYLPNSMATTETTTTTTAAIIINSSQQYASLLPSFLLLFTPTFLLGAITPYAVKLATNTLSTLGKTSGNLYSAATIGSIVGTFLTVYVLIPIFDIKYIFYALGLVLIIPSSIIGLRTVPKILAGSIVTLLILTNMVFLVVSTSPLLLSSSSSNNHSHPGTLVYQKETPYSHLDVVDLGFNNTIRDLYLDGQLHSAMNKDNPNELFVPYTKFFPLGFVFNPSAKNILFVGGGGFSGPKYFLKMYPKDVTVDVVEIDPVVIDVAKKYFNVTGSGDDGDNNDYDSRLHIYNEDAREFLSKNQEKKYDIIILDAYSKNYVPFHLMTLEYYSLLYKNLSTPNGVVVSNQLGSLEGAASNLYRAVYKTMSQVFPKVYVFPIQYFSSPSITTNTNTTFTSLPASTVSNIILVATKNPDKGRYSGDDIRREEEQQQPHYRTTSNNENDNNDNDNGTLNDNNIDYAAHVYNSTNIRIDDVPLLTDQFAPVENLLNPITGKPYTIDKQNPINKNIDLNSTEGTLFVLIVPSIVAGTWIFYMQTKIWKIGKMRKL